MPRSTLAPNPRKATPHPSPTSRKNHEATAVATPMLLTRSPLSESFRPWGETLVLGLERGRAAASKRKHVVVTADTLPHAGRFSVIIRADGGTGLPPFSEQLLCLRCGHGRP